MSGKPNSPISEDERRWLSGPTEKQKDERIQALERIAALEQQNAALLGLCRCGHSKEEHEGHTFALGSAPSNHCSQCCGRCLTYRPISQDVQKLVEAANAVEKRLHRASRGRAYAGHSSECEIDDSSSGFRCNCGFVDEVRALAEALKPFPPVDSL